MNFDEMIREALGDSTKDIGDISSDELMARLRGTRADDGPLREASGRDRDHSTRKWALVAASLVVVITGALAAISATRGPESRQVATTPASNAQSPAPESGLPDCVRNGGFEPLPLPGTEGDAALLEPDPERLRDAVWDRAALAVPQLGSDPDFEPVLDGCAVRSAAGGGVYIGITGDEATGYVLTGLRYPSESDEPTIGVRIQGDHAEASVPAGCGGCVADLAASYGREVVTATATADAESVAVTVTRSTGDPGALLLTMRDDTGDVVRVDGVQVPPGDFAAG